MAAGKGHSNLPPTARPPYRPPGQKEKGKKGSTWRWPKRTTSSMAKGRKEKRKELRHKGEEEPFALLFLALISRGRVWESTQGKDKKRKEKQTFSREFGDFLACEGEDEEGEQQGRRPKEKRGNVRRIAKAGERVSLPPPTNHLLFSSFSSLFPRWEGGTVLQGGKRDLKVPQLSRGKARGRGGRKKRRGSLLPPSPFTIFRRRGGKEFATDLVCPLH